MVLLRTRATSACHRACRANDISQSFEFQFCGATRPDRSAVNSGTRNAEWMRLLKGVPRHSKTTEDTPAMLSACEPARARPPRQPASLVLRPPALAPWGSPLARARGAERGHGATGAAACSPACRRRRGPSTSRASWARGMRTSCMRRWSEEAEGTILRVHLRHHSRAGEGRGRAELCAEEPAR